MGCEDDVVLLWSGCTGLWWGVAPGREGNRTRVAAGGLNSMDRFWAGGAGSLSAFQYGLEARGERNPEAQQLTDGGTFKQPPT